MLVSKTQANALREAAKDCFEVGHVAPEWIATAVVQMSSLSWHDHTHLLFAAGPFNESADASAKQPPRRQLQDWAALPSYFTAELWAFLKDSKINQATKLDALVNFAVKGGLRLPTENTLKIMTSTWLVCTEGPSTFLGSEQKLVFLKHLKAVFQQQRKRVTIIKASWARRAF
jgi:hypothetical protein